MSSRLPDVIVVGAGIVGAACAHALAQEGMQVQVLERRFPGGGATAAGMGHIVAMDDSPAQFALSRYAQQLWDDLQPKLPAGSEVSRCGTIWVAADDEEMAAVQTKAKFYQQHGVQTQVLDAASLQQAEANLHASMAGGLLVPGDSIVYPPVVAQWLLQQVEVIPNVTVTAVDGQGVTLADGRRMQAGAVVNAAGTHALDLLPAPLPGLTIQARKGHLAITDRYPGFCQHQLIELGYLKSAHQSDADSVAFNLQPRPNGQMLLGSSRQFGCHSTAVEWPMLQQMMARAAIYMPKISELQVIRTWTGMRAATADHLPIIGSVPGHDNLLLAAGHEGLGITTSLSTARLIADEIIGRESKIDRQPYRPDRLLEEMHHV